MSAKQDAAVALAEAIYGAWGGTILALPENVANALRTYECLRTQPATSELDAVEREYLEACYECDNASLALDEADSDNNAAQQERHRRAEVAQSRTWAALRAARATEDPLARDCAVELRDALAKAMSGGDANLTALWSLACVAVHQRDQALAQRSQS